MKALASILLFLMALSGAGTAFAEDVPLRCQTSSYVKKGYQAGVAQGKTLVERAWQSVNNCDRLETFTDLVIANVESYTLSGNSVYTICRFTGLHDGVFQKLDSIWATCEGSCCHEGEVIGTLAARLYCQLSIILDGLADPDEFVRRPVFFCGFAFQMCCDANFFSSSMVYRGLDLFGDLKECQPYTDGDYFQVWDDTRVLQCAYTPAELSSSAGSGSQ